MVRQTTWPRDQPWRSQHLAIREASGPSRAGQPRGLRRWCFGRLLHRQVRQVMTHELAKGGT